MEQGFLALKKAQKKPIFHEKSLFFGKKSLFFGLFLGCFLIKIYHYTQVFGFLAKEKRMCI